MSTNASKIKTLVLIFVEYRDKMSFERRLSKAHVPNRLPGPTALSEPALEVPMDELDELILQTLQKDGRTPFTHIARQAGVSETTIRSRYRGLEEAGIVRTVGVVDPFALGFQAPAIIGLTVEAEKMDMVAKTVAEFPEVSYLVMTLGSFDLTVEVFCRDLQELTELVTQKIGRIPGVRSTETLMIARSYKLSYRWSPVLNAHDGQAR